MSIFCLLSSRWYDLARPASASTFLVILSTPDISSAWVHCRRFGLVLVLSLAVFPQILIKFQGLYSVSLLTLAMGRNVDQGLKGSILLGCKYQLGSERQCSVGHKK